MIQILESSEAITEAFCQLKRDFKFLLHQHNLTREIDPMSEIWFMIPEIKEGFEKYLSLEGCK